jgi:hypothetical protein
MIKPIQHEVDYAAIERRLASSGELYKSSKLLDIHTITAAVILGLPYSKVCKRQRSNVGKTLNFTMLYTPGAMWEVPSEAALMAIWTEAECEQIRKDLEIEEPGALYPLILKHFNNIYGGKA